MRRCVESYCTHHKLVPFRAQNDSMSTFGSGICVLVNTDTIFNTFRISRHAWMSQILYNLYFFYLKESNEFFHLQRMYVRSAREEHCKKRKKKG